MKYRSWLKLGLITPLVLALLAEAGLRLAGVIDFPVYDTDEVIGYIPAPNQRGEFLNRNRWQINERSMGSEHWQPHGQRDLLLLGDSIVWGGNPLNQIDKFGPQLQESIPQWRVWSASAGSWSVLNQIAYLDRYPDVQREVDVVVWVLNTGDLARQSSQWASDSIHPRNRPHSALWYATEKYLVPRLATATSNQQPATTMPDMIAASTADQLHTRLVQLTGKRVLIVLYPNKTELSSTTPHYLAFRQALRSAMGSCCDWLEVREHPMWNAGLYRDSIHPTPEGNRVLASLIAKQLALR